MRRAAARAPREGGAELLADLLRHALPEARRFEERYPPERCADLVLSGANPLGLDPGPERG
jgi:hypothetical protein